MRAAVLLLAVTLAACQEPAAPPQVEPAPAPAQAQEAPPEPAGLGDIDARGNEPFWFAKVRGETLELERPDQATVITPAQKRVEGERTIWEGRAFTVAATPQPGCSDGMSDLTYPLAVEVTMEGQVMKGCGALEGELPTGER
jgi:uncharacterized membrane protein